MEKKTPYFLKFYIKSVLKEQKVVFKDNPC